MTRTTTDYGAIAAAAPVDRQAALIRDGRADAYAGKVPAWCDHWHAPPPPEGRPPADLPRLEGRVFGDHMRVVRYHGARADGARWLVRCACGAYELRRTKAIHTAKSDHRCQACNWVARQAFGYARDKADPDWRDKQPASLKLRLSIAEIRFLLASAEGAPDPAFTAADRAALAAKIRDRLSGVDRDAEGA